MSVFTWVPSYGSDVESTFKMWEAPFGDGYTQRAAIGINNVLDKWNLVFNLRQTAEKNAIRDFLRAHSGGQSFDWTPYGEASAVKVFCRSFKISADGYDTYNITCTFERVYGE